MDVCRMDADIEQQAQAVYQNVPFAAFNLFATIATRFSAAPAGYIAPFW
jgi:hypothetical protein